MSAVPLNFNLNWMGSSVIPGTIPSEDLPKISLITPSFNQGHFLEQTILSVLNQNYPNLEYIIIDGGSTDNSVEIIRKYEKYLKFWVSEKDKGQTDAINKGFQYVTGEIFNWLNSDDMLAEGTLWEVGRFFKSNSSYSSFAGREYRFQGDKFINKSFGTTVEDSLEKTLLKAHIDQPSTFFRTQTLRPIFPLDVSLRFCMDNQMWLNYLLNQGIGSFKAVDQVFAYFRYHNDSKTFINAPKFKEEQIKLLSDISVISQGNPSKYFKGTFKAINAEVFSGGFIPYKEKYELDPSLIFRESAAYYKMMGLREPALFFSKMALKKRPMKWINHKYFWSIRLKR